MLPVVWMPEAVADLKEALSWYEERHPYLGSRFALAAEEAVSAISETPLRFAVVYKKCRRAGVRRFPYGLIFQVEADRIVVLACFHGKRDPRRWQRAVKA